MKISDASPASFSPLAPAERDWSQALRQDAQALHDDAATNHPGPINPLDPDFAKRNDAGLALAPEARRTGP